jgi:hypothetical protein
MISVLAEVELLFYRNAPRQETSGKVMEAVIEELAILRLVRSGGSKL